MSGSQKHHNALPPQEQLDCLLNSQWESEVLPQLPKELEEAARRLKAFQRVRQVASATDLLRALLVYALCELSWRQLGVSRPMQKWAEMDLTAPVKRTPKNE